MDFQLVMPDKLPHLHPQVIPSPAPVRSSLLLLTQLPPLQSNGSFQVVLHFVVGRDHEHFGGASPSTFGHDDAHSSGPARARDSNTSAYSTESGDNTLHLINNNNNNNKKRYY